MNRVSCAASLFVLGLMVGCSSSESPAPVATTSTSSESGPSVATRRFMTLLSKGDIAGAEQMLTAQSQAKLKATGMGFRDPGFGSGAFEVGRVEQPGPGDAVVQCMVSVPGDDNEPATKTEICWCLRKDQGEWRVLGFAVQDETLPQPVIWNFETDDGPQMAAPDATPAAPAQTVGAPTDQPAASTANAPGQGSTELR